MKYLLFFLLSFSVTAKEYKIQVFRVSDGEMLYGLHANDTNRTIRLANAMELHNPPLTTLVDEDITIEMREKREARDFIINRKEFIKNYSCGTITQPFLKAFCFTRK